MGAGRGKSSAEATGRPAAQASTKQRIVDAAIDLFSRRGYEAVSMQDIADVVGIRKATIYSHFRAKEEILQTILDHFNRETAKARARQQDEDALIETYLSSSGPAALMAVVGKQFEDLLKAPDLRKIWRMIAIEVYRNTMIRSFFEREMLEQPARFWEKAFRAMMDRGMIRRADAALLAREYHAFHVYMYVKYLVIFNDEESEMMHRRAEEEGAAHIRFFLDMMSPKK